MSTRLIYILVATVMFLLIMFTQEVDTVNMVVLALLKIIVGILMGDDNGDD
jgi:hypothetical protein